MIPALTTNTQAILLLTAPLLTGHGQSAADLLSLRDYNRLARLLREVQKQPADLIGPQAADLLKLCAAQFGQERLDSLLGRGFLLSQAVERWRSRAIWVMSRADPGYPKLFKARLKEDAPPILYGCGDPELLQKGGLAVVGSRHVDHEIVRYTEAIGRLSAHADRTLVSGGAKGIDCAAMRGAVEAGGQAVGILADNLERAALVAGNRESLIDGRLVLVSPYDPNAGFNVGNAMQRNKLIYALAQAALVVNSDFEKGGTWAGAIEQLERFHFVPVFVRNDQNTGKGNPALVQRGGRPWPEPRDARELNACLAAAAERVTEEAKQESFSFELREAPPIYEVGHAELLPVQNAADSTPEASELTPAATLLAAVGGILSPRLATPATEAEIAEMLV